MPTAHVSNERRGEAGVHPGRMASAMIERAEFPVHKEIS
jgi:hypothetical protein